MPFRPEKTAHADVVEKKRTYGLCEAKRRADKARSRTRVNVSLALSTEGEAGDEERSGAGLLSVGQVGAKYVDDQLHY